MSSQVTLGSNCASTHSLNAAGVLRAGDRLLEVAEGQRPAAERRRSRSSADGTARSSPRRTFAHALGSPTIALRVSRWRAPTTARSIGQDQHGRADRPRARHQVLRVAAVAHHVELEPRRRASSPSRPPRSLQIETVDSTNGTPGASAARAACTSARGANIPAEADRRQHDRERQPLAEHLDRRIADADVAHHDLAQQHVLEVGDVRAHRRLLVRAAVDVVEQLARQPAPRQLAVVEHRRRGDAERAVGGEAHRREGRPDRPGRGSSCGRYWHTRPA